MAGSAHTRERGLRSRDVRSPTASAIRYEGTGCGISKSIVRIPRAVPPSPACGPADITAVSDSGIVIAAW